MTKFMSTFKDALNMVEYEWDSDSNQFKIDEENLLSLIENMVLSSIYDPEFREEVYKDKTR